MSINKRIFIALLPSLKYVCLLLLKGYVCISQKEALVRSARRSLGMSLLDFSAHKLIFSGDFVRSSRGVLLTFFCHFVGTILKSLLVNDSFEWK